MRDVRGEHPGSAPPRRQRGSAEPDVHLPRLLSVVHPGGSESRELPRSPRPIPVRPGIAHRAGPVGTTADTSRNGFLLSQFLGRKDCRLLSEPRWRNGIPSFDRSVGSNRCRQPGPGDDPARCRSAARTKGRGPHRLLHRSDGCVLRARGPHPEALEGLRGRTGGVGGDRRLLLPAPQEGRRTRPWRPR